MKKTIRAMVLLAVIALIGLSMTGCEWLLEEALTSISGTVVDGRTGGGTTDPDGVVGVTVTLTPVNGGSALTATTDTNGYFSVDYENEGVYRLTASKSGWFFVPQDVNISGWLGTTSDVIGIETGGSKGLSTTLSNALTLVLVWNDGYEDIDSHLTYTDDDGAGDALAAAYNVEAAFAGPYASWTAIGGFGPESSDRDDVSPAGDNYTSTAPISHSDNTVAAVLDNGETSSVYAIQLDRDDRDGEGPEVLTINTIPVWPVTDWDGNGDFAGTTANGLPVNAPSGLTAAYTWTGVMEYYVDGWDATESTDNSRDTNDADHYLDNTAATVYAVQGSVLLGEFPIPSNVNARILSVLRINTFVVDDGANDYTTYMQIAPDIKVVDGYVNILSTDQPIYGAFGPGRSR